MATFVVLGNWTAEGVRPTPMRPSAPKPTPKPPPPWAAGSITNYWTLGKYDFVSIIEAPSDEAVTAGLLVAAATGFARSVTMRAFTMDEFEGIVAQAKAAG